ncbi:hypothetical protein [Candidatus Similichlamydia laticola]|uniref:Uncharacterized protein n=1 Tax=Candidatus Similichlamydia laticola TaxID=2170265 RepID=A0A369K9P4_9BACT|nr:hypothetical protein [Candidatus Similichlamydia laticola]RDB31311.1 hypothetical protein HAT2_00586 [Candidatus Similichlamydia laticola]
MSSSSEIKQKWQPTIPNHDEDDGFVAGPIDTPHYVIPSKSVYTLDEIEKVSLSDLQALEALVDPEGTTPSTLAAQITAARKERDLFSRLRRMSEPSPTEPLISIRDLVEKLLDAFAALLKAKGKERLANLIILQFRLEEAISDLILQVREVREASIQLQMSD